MTPSSIFCRTQAALQRERANAAALQNVRKTAMTAAIAWDAEATLAEAREAKTLLRAASRPAATVAADDDGAADDPDDWDAAFSENPDRGLAAAGPATVAP